ncbi:MAG: carboxypeptidase-like regulatory domain-containing protein, partial [Blastocatellia bacterium]
MRHSGQRNSGSRIILLLCCLITITATAFAQTFQGSLRGAVRDAGGQVVAGATLTLTNPATSIARTTVANDAGEYAFERIDPGRYVLTVTRDGFKKLERQNVTIETQQQLSLDLQLEVGNVSESVTVTDEVPLIETA